MDCAFDDDRTIVVAKVDFANFRQCGPLYTQKSILPIPHDHIPYAIGKTGLMACINMLAYWLRPGCRTNKLYMRI